MAQRCVKDWIHRLPRLQSESQVGGWAERLSPLNSTDKQEIITVLPLSISVFSVRSDSEEQLPEFDTKVFPD